MPFIVMQPRWRLDRHVQRSTSRVTRPLPCCVCSGDLVLDLFPTFNFHVSCILLLHPRCMQHQQKSPSSTMDIFVQNVPDHATRRHIEDFFRNVFSDCGIKKFHAEKLGDKPLANITVLDVAAAQVFLDRYGRTQHPRRGQPRLHWGGKYIIVSRSKNEVSPWALKSLADTPQKSQPSAVECLPGTKGQASASFPGITLQCGRWEYVKVGGQNAQLVFVSEFTDNRPGRIVVGSKEAVILLGPDGSDQCRIDFSYHPSDCIDIVVGTYEEPSITFNLNKAPK